MFGHILKDIASAVKRLVDPETADARRAPRLNRPAVVVYYWDGSSPEGRHLRDVSKTGAYICTKERWYPGTIIRLVLQGVRTTPDEKGCIVTPESACIPSRVVRQGADGVALEFLFSSPQEEAALHRFLATIPAQPPTTSQSSGQSLIEFALILPLLFLIVVNLVNFGGFFFAWITITNAARAGAQYMTMSTASLGKPSAPSAAQITTLVTSDVSSLPNKSSLVVRICTNNNGTTSCKGGGSYAPPADPEPATYQLASVDVTYTYKPFISQWNFSKLGVSATLPATTIHQRAAMRIEQ